MIVLNDVKVTGLGGCRIVVNVVNLTGYVIVVNGLKATNLVR